MIHSNGSWLSGKTVPHPLVGATFFHADFWSTDSQQTDIYKRSQEEKYGKMLSSYKRVEVFDPWALATLSIVSATWVWIYLQELFNKKDSKIKF